MVAQALVFVTAVSSRRPILVADDVATRDERVRQRYTPRVRLPPALRVSLSTLRRWLPHCLTARAFSSLFLKSKLRMKVEIELSYSVFDS